MFPWWLWDLGISGSGFFLEGVLRTVLRDDKGVSLHLHVSRVVDRIHRVLCFISFFLVFI
jgi:hypothetical protein